jgi:DNA-binding LytR/AlgR family response regulator
MNTLPILNCAIIDDDELSRQIIEKYVAKSELLNLMASLSSAEEATSLLARQDVELLFLDIEMPDISGLDLIKQLVSRPYVIFTTAKTDYAIEAFEYDIVDYLLKPISYLRFMKAVTKVINLSSSAVQSSNSDDLFVKLNSRYVKIPCNEVLWIEAIGDYVEIHTNEKKYTAHTTMKALEKKLPLNDFVRVHRSYIVRTGSIVEIEDNTLVVNKKLIPIGKSYRDALLKNLNLI